MKSDNLSETINELCYAYSNYDKLILDEDMNIGDNGENLTIVVLSFNRAELTINLLKSIEKYLESFKGKILIADNNSNLEEIKKIEEYINTSKLIIKLVKYDQNYGVAGGRNRTLKYIETAWFMNLDNDIYFISNPLKEIKNTIALTGAKFINLPLLSADKKAIFSNGGSLFFNIQDGEAVIGGGSTFYQGSVKEIDPLEPSLSTFLLGGSSVLNKQAFLDCGTFDDNMFIGFEDIDFSLTIFEKGMKIANCPTFSLVHNHVFAINNNISYEKNRFNNEILKKSATYFEQKRKFRIWDANLEIWLNNRKKELGISESKELSTENVKPNIALIVDVEDWCFWNNANKIAECLKEYYNFEIIPLENINNNIIKLFFYVYKFDLVHFFWRGHLSFIESDFSIKYLESCNLSLEDFKNKYLNQVNITTSVYDHLYLDDPNFTNNILKYCQNYTTSSKKLFDIYNKDIRILKKPKMIITDGVDLNLFKPQNLKRFEENKKLVIGWVGNSAWISENEDFKGFNTILKPAINELINEGYDISFYFADKQNGMISHSEMPKYYAKIDVLICTSKFEGTPNPILEAMACGVPIISTNVGIVSDAFGEKQKEFILKNRNIKELKTAIIKLVNTKKLLKELSFENLQQIEKFDWQYKSMEFKKFFDENIKQGVINEKEDNIISKK